MNSEFAISACTIALSYTVLSHSPVYINPNTQLKVVSRKVTLQKRGFSVIGHWLCLYGNLWQQWRSQKFQLEGPRLPFLPFSPFVPSLPALPFYSSLPFPCPPLSLSFPLKVGPPKIQLGAGERCELPQRGLRRRPSRNRILCILALKDEIWWQQFYCFLKIN